ncbi:SAM-dependent methyltransferase [Streptomyces profundus]|uniref:SAM-dependent methyltransferase n=1 Tax=Streptomyces profundus TaxID=2867410 RepID=UPI001D162A9D|nr:SAM-dependent methyltransferase [Streptomyces sp. MA3_2.13]UED88473.1 SAM-dependent methyltransferase [Streptomyces sp. MA3_2.13]
MVAAARAIEAHRHDALADDPYAEHFVRAEPACAGWPLRPWEVPAGEADPLWGRLGRYFGLRTRVMDDFLLDAAGAGVRQLVVLGAGLDTRALRLPWPPGCVVFEIDRDPVLTFKRRVLAELPTGSPGGAEAAARVGLVADLREPWEAALARAGFDPARPTAWLAEGLLLYLPAATERRLMDTVDRLSAAGSVLAYEAKLTVESAEVRASPEYAAARDRIGVDLLALFDAEPRPDSARDLADRGWIPSVHTPFEFTHRHGRGPLPRPPDALAGNRWVFAHRR